MKRANWKNHSTALYKHFLKELLGDIFSKVPISYAFSTSFHQLGSAEIKRKLNIYCFPNPKEGWNLKACLCVTIMFDLNLFLQTMTHQKTKYFWGGRISYVNSQHWTSQQSIFSRWQPRGIILCQIRRMLNFSEELCMFMVWFKLFFPPKCFC